MASSHLQWAIRGASATGPANVDVRLQGPAQVLKLMCNGRSVGEVETGQLWYRAQAGQGTLLFRRQLGGLFHDSSCAKKYARQKAHVRSESSE